MEEPIISLSKCTGCDICVEECPTDVFRLASDRRARVVAPYQCIDCGLCEEDCPTNAIRLVAA